MAAAATWHVSPGGDDTASGEAGAPFRTIQRAVEAARAGDTVLLHEGIYRETVRPEHDGRPDAPITLTAAPGARPIVSALDPITGPWVFDGNGRYSAAVPAAPALGKVADGVAPALSTGMDQIFIDGIVQPEARHPNRSGSDPLDHEGLALKVDENFRIIAPELARLPDNALAGARFHGHVHPAWTAQSGVVVSSRADEVRMDPSTLSTPWWPNRARSGGNVDADVTYSPVHSAGSGYFFGTKALLDAEGEWIIERSAAGDTLRLLPPGERHPDTLRIERKVRPWTIDLDGRSHWILRDLQLVGGAVRLRGEHLVLDRCELRHPTHFLTFALGYGYDGGLPQGGAILFEGRQSTVRACVVRASAGSGINLKGEGHLVTRNQLHDIDYSGTYAAGITVGGNGHVVEFNTIRDSGRDAIALAGGGHRILFNDLSRAGRLAMDGGGLYTYGQNGADRTTGRPTEIAYNWVHESGQPDDPKNRGIYIDNYSRGFVVHHNVLWGLGHPGKNKGLHIGAPSIDVDFYHNTLIGVLPPTEASYTKFPLTNRDPEFWTASNNRLAYHYQNNLHIPATIPPEMVLENPKTGDYRPRAGSSNVNPATTESVKVWQTSDGKTGVPAGYTLYVQDKSVPFSFSETSGQGVSLPGINDGFTGTSPDDGAYERGLPLWRPGHDGYSGDASPYRRDLVGRLVSVAGSTGGHVVTRFFTPLKAQRLRLLLACDAGSPAVAEIQIYQPE